MDHSNPAITIAQWVVSIHNNILLYFKIKNMKPIKILRIIVLLMLTVTTKNAFTQGIYSPPAKKIVAYNMVAPSPAYYRDNLAEIEKQPINGLFIRLPIEAGRGQIFKIDQLPYHRKKRTNSKI